MREIGDTGLLLSIKTGQTTNQQVHLDVHLDFFSYVSGKDFIISSVIIHSFCSECSE